MTQSTSPREPVLASWKISDVLKRYPELLDVLIGLSPAFGRLRNPILRQVQSRLATVAQAAQVAGLEPAALVQTLNAAIGLATPVDAVAGPADRQADGLPPAWVGDVAIAEELDVRPYQRRGEEPFSAIMAVVARVPAGQALRLRNTFEPLPLYGVLGKRGFLHWARQLGPDDWEILFYKANGAAGPSTALPERSLDVGRPEVVGESTAKDEPAWENPTATVTIDVSDLVPPEPMVRILEAMNQLGPEETLLVHHVRRPIYLYPRLDALGYLHETRERGPDQVEILIRKPAVVGR